MIRKLRTSYLLPEDIVETVEKYLTIVAPLSASEPFIGKVTDLMQHSSDQLRKALDSVHLSQFVSKIAELHAVRDDLFIGFREMIDSHKRRRNNVLIEAYEKIWEVIEASGTELFMLSYAEQSKAMKVMFRTLDLPDNQQALKTLHADEIYMELKNAQVDFDAVYDGELDEETKENYPSVGEAKGQLLPLINSLFDAINILRLTEPGKHSALSEQLNAVTLDAMKKSRAGVLA